MRYFVCIALCAISLMAEKLEWDNLSASQKSNAITIYEIAKEYDLAETMIAIAWQESRLGLVSINLDDPSCGLFHFTTKTYLWQNNMKDTLHNRNVVCMDLINSVELSTRTAIEYFLKMKKHFKDNHNKAIMSYNVGYNLNNKRAKNYLENVKNYMVDAENVVEMIKIDKLLNFINKLAYIESVEELLF